MYRLFYNADDLFALQGRNFRPNGQDSVRLVRAAEHGRILREMRAKPNRSSERSHGLVARVRMAFSRA